MTPISDDPSSRNLPPITTNDSILACPVLLEAQRTLEKAHDLRKALRKLSRSTRRCLTCPENNNCPSIRYFDHAVDLAVHQLTHEWGLDQD